MASSLRVVSCLTLDEALLRIGRTEEGVLVDLENTVVSYGSGSDPEGVEQRICALPLSAAVVLSNSRWPCCLREEKTRLRVLARARKPFTSRRKLHDLLGQAPRVVIGDQFITDGLLAWRLGITFVHLRRVPEHEPLWPKLMRLVGVVACRLLVRDRVAVHDER